MNGAVLLHLLPNNMLYLVLNKLNNVEICRMRRTCSKMDEFIEEQRRNLAARPHMGMKIRLVGDQSNPKQIDVRPLRPLLSHLTFPVDSDFSKKISAISISFLSIHCYGENEEIFHRMKAAVDILKPTCSSAEITGMPADYVKEIVDSMDCRGEIRILHYWSDARLFLGTLSQAKNRGKLDVKMNSRHYSSEGIFELVKDFHSFDGYSFTPDTFFSLLWDIYNLKGSLNIQWLYCEVSLSPAEASFDFPFVNPSLPSPPTKLLWDVSILSEDRIVPNYLPQRIRQMTLKSGKNSVIIVERTHGRHSSFVDEDIFILANDSNVVLEAVAEKLQIKKIDDGLREEYSVASDERRMEILSQMI